MALRTTTKVRLMMHSSVEKQVLSFLQKVEAFELIESKDAKKGGEVEYTVASLDFAIGFLSRYAPGRKGVRAKFLGEKIEISENDARKIIAQCDWKGTVKALTQLESEKNDFLRSIADNTAEIALLSGWEGVKKSSFGGFATAFFRVHAKDFAEFSGRVEDVSKYIDFSLVSQKGNDGYYSVIARDADLAQIRVIVQALKGVEVNLPTGDIKGRISSLQATVNAIEAKLAENKEKVISYLPELDGLKMTYDCFSAKGGVEKALNSSLSLIAGVSVIEGWMIEDDILGLTDQIKKQWNGVAIEKVECEENEKIPVLLENNSAIRPFEVVTGMYGAPKSDEIDPTPFLSIFFVIFFGLCLTDAAYGMILTIVMASILMAKMPLDKGMREMVKLLLYSGVSTVFFGILFGGWFGIDPNASFIPKFLTYAVDGGRMFLGQIVSPAQDLVTKIAPLVLLGGVLHLLLGVVLSGYVALKNNKTWDAFVVALPTFITIVSGIGMAFVGKGFLPVEFSPILKSVLIAGFAVMTVGIMRSGGPIQWFMDVTGWLSNTLSYARLFALGLATGVVAQVFNTVAFTIGDMMPTGLDILVIVFIILFGHTLNIALNLLGAFVHSGRLQFVEFFGQFLEGGGVFFSPLKKTFKYIYTEKS